MWVTNPGAIGCAEESGAMDTFGLSAFTFCLLVLGGGNPAGICQCLSWCWITAGQWTGTCPTSRGLKPPGVA